MAVKSPVPESIELAELAAFAHTGQNMALEPSDVVFIAIVIWLAIEILNGNSGGGKRSRVPA